ncbi:hypothetical protein J6590_003831 [Homalodisca vitripennis]|nr:hypothetical protein J6590_003831 [Homalodisca vitripennis]
MEYSASIRHPTSCVLTLKVLTTSKPRPAISWMSRSRTRSSILRSDSGIIGGQSWCESVASRQVSQTVSPVGQFNDYTPLQVYLSLAASLEIWTVFSSAARGGCEAIFKSSVGIWRQIEDELVEILNDDNDKFRRIDDFTLVLPFNSFLMLIFPHLPVTKIPAPNKGVY